VIDGATITGARRTERWAEVDHGAEPTPRRSSTPADQKRKMEYMRFILTAFALACSISYGG
jgi:hypothetical protein